MIQIIFCNDAPMAACEDKRAAARLLRRMAARSYVGQRWMWESYKHYRSIQYWHIHQIPLHKEAAK